MSQEPSPQVEKLIMQALAAGNTPEGVALAEEAVREADAAEDIESSYEARNQLIRIAVFSGFHEKALVAFSWCLAKADERPDAFPVSELLWNYKWVIEELVHFPRISRTQIITSIEDFQARSLRAGYSARPALFLRWMCELWMGNGAAAEQWLGQWKAARRDSMADCRACEVNRETEFHATLDRHERALRIARPILEGRLRCAEVPHITHATLLRSFWLTGQREAAQEQHLKGYRLVRNNHNFIREQSWHLAHLLRSGQLEPATAMLRKHLPWALETKSLDNRFYFLVPGHVCAQRLLKQGVSSLRCRLPGDVCPVARKSVVPLAELSDWMGETISQLATHFDARNGNNAFGSLAQTMRQELEG